MARSLSLSATFALGPGRNPAGTRHALAPRRKSIEAGWIWSSRSFLAAEIAPDLKKAR